MKFKYLFILLLFVSIILSTNVIAATEVDLNGTILDELAGSDSEFNVEFANSNYGILSEEEDYTIIYVSSDASSDGNGSYENPYSSLKEACDNINGENKTTINLLKGTYYIGSELKFKTNNLVINGFEDDVIIKNELNTRNAKQALELSSSLSNFTLNNVIVDGSGWSQATTARQFFYPFYGAANYVSYNNCTFIGSFRFCLSGTEDQNLIFDNCIFKDFNSLFRSELKGEKFLVIKNSIFLSPSMTIFSTHLDYGKNITINNIWFGQNEIPNYLKSLSTYSPSGGRLDPTDLPVEQYAIFSVYENYLGDNQYEIIGKLCWNGTNDTVGDVFAPMTVTLTSASGEIQSNATLENGVFRAVYTSNSSDNLVTATLDYQPINLNFTNVDFQVDAPSIFYGQDQNITITSPLASNATVNVTVNNKTYEVKFNDSSVVTFTVPEVLKEGTYPVEVLLNDNENHIFGSNSTELVVSKVSDYAFEVIPSTDVKVGDNVTITITLPDDVNGTVTVKFGNETQILQANTTMTVTFNNLNATTYPINVTYGGNDKYTSKEAIDSVTVNKADSSLEIENAVFTYGDVIAIPFNVTNANGVTFSVLNKDDDEVATGSSESNVIALDVLPAGEYTLYAKTVVDTANYEWVDATINLTINKANSSLEISDKEFTYADEAIINAVTENSTGDVIATLLDENNNEIEVTVSGDNITLPLLNAGKYTLTVTTNVTDNYNDVTESVIVSIVKATPDVVIIADISENLTDRDNVTVTVKLPVDASGLVLLQVGDIKVYDELNSEGSAEFILGNLAENTYEITARYLGDDNYKESTNKTETFKVSKWNIMPVEVNVTVPSDIKVGDKFNVDVAVPNATGNVTIIIDGVDTVVPLDENGTASVPVEGLSVGNHGIVVMYSGDDTHTSAYKATSVNVEKLSSQFNVTEGKTFETYAVETGIGEQGALYAFVLRDSNGNPIANATVTFAYKATVFNSTTDENGTLYLGISTYLAQDALCAMSYLGDETHDATFVAFNFKIQKKATALKASAQTYKVKTKKKLLTVTLKTNKGASRDGKVYLKKGKTVTLTVNGVTYTGKTNANGQVTFKITNLNKKGKYKAVIKFAGTDTYQGSKIKVNIKVK